MMVDENTGIKRPDTFTITIWEKPLAVMGEFYIGLIPVTVLSTTQVTTVDC